MQARQHGCRPMRPGQQGCRQRQHRQQRHQHAGHGSRMPRAARSAHSPRVLGRRSSALTGCRPRLIPHKARPMHVQTGPYLIVPRACILTARMHEKSVTPCRECGGCLQTYGAGLNAGAEVMQAWRNAGREGRRQRSRRAPGAVRPRGPGTASGAQACSALQTRAGAAPAQPASGSPPPPARSMERPVVSAKVWQHSLITECAGCIIGIRAASS